MLSTSVVRRYCVYFVYTCMYILYVLFVLCVYCMYCLCLYCVYFVLCIMLCQLLRCRAGSVSTSEPFNYSKFPPRPPPRGGHLHLPGPHLLSTGTDDRHSLEHALPEMGAHACGGKWLPPHSHWGSRGGEDQY